MFKKFLILLVFFFLFLPLIAGAEERTPQIKLDKWREAFDKRNVERVIADKDYFSFTADELNSLLNSESRKAKNPLADNYQIILDGGIVKFQANFKKFIKGKIYLEARPLENKIGFKILKAKYCGLRIPASWAEKALNKEVDKYFAFLYQDNSYQGAQVIIKDKTAKLLLEFK